MSRSIIKILCLISIFVLTICLFLVFPRYLKKSDKIKSNYINIYNNQDSPVIFKYQDDSLNGAIPELDNNMNPVYYDNEEKVWKKADILEKWYSYKEQWWANVVVVKKEYLSEYKKMFAHQIINLIKYMVFMYGYQGLNINYSM